MIYASGREWLEAKHKRVALFGMSGLGKTHLSTMLRGGGEWYHYSVDYRIGTRYMGEVIADDYKREAMKSPYLRALLLSDSITIRSKIRFENLAPLSHYLGKPGRSAAGGLSWAEYTTRQRQHETAERAAMLDTGAFIAKAQDIYGYPHFICDTSGSFCEIVEPEDPQDPLLTALSREVLLVWIEGSEAHRQELVRRFDVAPKPMYYHPDFLARCWQEYLAEKGVNEAEVDPDDFIRATFARALAHRQPRYRAVAGNWGVKVRADEVAGVETPEDFNRLIAAAIDRSV